MGESAVIIGAGIAGLTTAAYLARAGLEVAVYEQHTLPGGYVSSFERGGFVFPAGPTSFGSNRVVFPILEELGLAGRCHFLRGAHQISWGEYDVPLGDPEQVARDLAERLPAERRRLARYSRWIRLGGNGFRTMLESGLMFGRGVLRTMLPLLVRRIFDQLGYPVMPARNTLGMWMTYLNDTWVPRGGMQAFADLLVGFIREHGGQVHHGRAVERIRVTDGAVMGVTLADGSEVTPRWVVSAADLHHTCFHLIGREHLPQALVAKFEQTRPSEAAFAVSLGLRGSPELDRALARAEEFIPGLRAHIEVQDAASPLTCERYTRNRQAGTAGWSWGPKLAPRFNLARDLPLERFYAVGHYVFNPGGVPTAMITAWYIAGEILKQRGAHSTEQFGPSSVLEGQDPLSRPITTTNEGVTDWIRSTRR